MRIERALLMAGSAFVFAMTGAGLFGTVGAIVGLATGAIFGMKITNNLKKKEQG